VNAESLRAFPLGARLESEASPLLKDLKPVFARLLQELIYLPDGANADSILTPFKVAVEAINAFASDIETVERECLLGLIYEIGALVGIPANEQFAEEWRGDW
jgi:hypothetical protein